MTRRPWWEDPDVRSVTRTYVVREVPVEVELRFKTAGDDEVLLAERTTIGERGKVSSFENRWRELQVDKALLLYVAGALLASRAVSGWLVYDDEEERGSSDHAWEVVRGQRPEGRTSAPVTLIHGHPFKEEVP